MITSCGIHFHPTRELAEACERKREDDRFYGTRCQSYAKLSHNNFRYENESICADCLNMIRDLFLLGKLSAFRVNSDYQVYTTPCNLPGICCTADLNLTSQLIFRIVDSSIS